MTEPFRYLTLASSLSTEATYCFIPESPTSGDWVEELCQGVRQARFSTSRYFKLLLFNIRNKQFNQQFKDMRENSNAFVFRTFKCGITFL